MIPETLKEAKNFRTQTGFCSLLLWAFTIFMIVANPDKLGEVIIVPIGAIILTVIHFNMKSKIKDYEKSATKS